MSELGNGPFLSNIKCGPNGQPVVVKKGSGSITATPATRAEMRDQAIKSAEQNYASYAATFLSSPLKLMIETSLWVELWAVIGFLVGFGLLLLMGQRTVPVVLLIVYEIVLTPVLSTVGTLT